MGYGISHHFSEVSGFSISVLDKLDDYWRTCDKQRPFEFNLRIFGKGIHGMVPFMHNNFASDPNYWHKVCDGKFSTTNEAATLNSSKVKITLSKTSANSFTLSWQDTRLNFSGEFQLSKIDDRP